MPGIQYVCLSDLHLGEEGSILTHLDDGGHVDPSEAAPVVKHLRRCLETLIDSDQQPLPTLVLNGDLLELALQKSNLALEVYARFLQEVRPLFSRAVYLAGNHDHHLWESDRETQYLGYIEAFDPASGRIDAPWHTTKVFPTKQKDRLVNRYLTAAAKNLAGAGDDFHVLSAYPNHGIRNADGTRAVVFHHGHFIEKIYRASSLAASYFLEGYKQPDNVYDLVGHNWAWIDFFWSTLGRSTPGIERLWDSLKNGEDLQKITDFLAQQVAKRHDVPIIPGDLLEEKTLKLLFRNTIVRWAGRMERQVAESPEPLSEGAITELHWYVEEMLFQQLRNEEGELPRELSFVFGHTHKPFERLFEFQGADSPVPVFNTGGWVVDFAEVRPVIGGAMVLISPQCDVVNLRVYNEGAYAVRVATPDGLPSSPFHDEIAALADSHRAPWADLSETIQDEVEKRHQLNRQALQNGA